MVDSKKPFYMQENTGLGSCSPDDDLLHPEANAREPGDSLTETQFLGFSIPEENIHGLGYLWHHPNLHVVSGGAWAFQGIKNHVLSCELFDFRAYMSDRILDNDLHSYRMENSYGVDLIEPLNTFRMTYHNSDVGNAIDLEFNAVTPGVMFGSGMHMEQGMRATGELVLRGQTYQVDCYTIRDRSWGQLRPESQAMLPPMTWMTGVFDDNFMFACTAADHPDLNPEWAEHFDLPVEMVLKGGWVYVDGQFREVVKVSKYTRHDPDTLYPDTIEMTLTDIAGVDYTITGKIRAACAWAAWPNFLFPVCLVEWTCQGKTGWGDAQEAQWPEYVRLFRK